MILPRAGIPKSSFLPRALNLDANMLLKLAKDYLMKNHGASLP